MKRNLAVLILYFEKLNLTIECIKSVIKSGVPIYVLNNASSIKGWEKLKTKFRIYNNIKFIHSDINLGPAGGRNKLISESNEEWLLFLDNDIHVKTNNWHQIFQEYIKNNRDMEVFIPKLYNVHEKSFVKHHKYAINNKNIDVIWLNGQHNTNFFPGGASLVNRKVFERLGLYDDNLFVIEDLEFPIRALVRNEPLHAMLIDEIVLIHKHIYTSRKEDHIAVLERYKSEKNEYAQKYICEKYDIIFNAHWEEWVDKQIYLIIRNDHLRQIKNKIFRLFKW